MSTYKLSFILLSVSVITSVTQAQGTFQNLDFELADIPASASTASLVPISEALPDWSAYFSSGGVTYPQSQVYYNAVSLGGNVISLDDAKEFPPLQGEYSVILFGGGNNPYYSASISQTGVIPAGTESLLMDAYLPAGASVTPVVAINGQPIDMTPLQSFVHYTVWGGNIPAADIGQSVTLSFTEPPEPSSGAQPSIFELDNISFSPSAIPEPNPLALTGIGGLLFALYRRFAARRR
jgi:hypothetical protein